MTRLMDLKNALLAATAFMVLGACTATSDGGPPVTETADAVPQSEAWRADFLATRIRADVEFLADDMLQGRDTGSEGHRIAANYVAAQFKRLGFKPAGDNGSFFQEVPFDRVALDLEKSSLVLNVGGERVTLEAGADYYMAQNVHVPDMELAGDLVFVGYGIYAPTLGRDDLKDLDLDGKIAVLFSGAPTSMNSEVRAHYGSTAGKAEALLARGAKGILILNSPAAEKRWNGPGLMGAMKDFTMSWRPQPGTDTSISGRFSALVSHAAIAPLFEGAEKSLEQVLADYETDSMTGFALMGSAEAKRVGIMGESFTSPNVLAVYEGGDADLADEYVVTSAHLDHVGVGRGLVSDDVIHNGAMDNATGIATLLEVARNLAAQPDKPRRSILFAAVTAEEKGLLGAEYFAHYPTVEKSALVGNVNLDMPVLLYDFTDVIAFGAERSSLGPITAAAVAKAGVSLSPDPLPEQGLFTRSDHYRFVQQGIPAVFLMTGFAETADGELGRDKFMEFLTTTYHTPADQPDLPIRYDAGAKFAYVNYLILTDIANGDERPSWNEGDFFGTLFGGR